jgi:hypothetical protein
VYDNIVGSSYGKSTKYIIRSDNIYEEAIYELGRIGSYQIDMLEYHNAVLFITKHNLRIIAEEKELKK